MWIEGERAEDRNTRFHLPIVRTERLVGTRSGHKVWLQCGHVVLMFGPLELAEGKALCQECRAKAGTQ